MTWNSLSSSFWLKERYQLWHATQRPSQISLSISIIYTKTNSRIHWSFTQAMARFVNFMWMIGTTQIPKLECSSKGLLVKIKQQKKAEGVDNLRRGRRSGKENYYKISRIRMIKMLRIMLRLDRSFCKSFIGCLVKDNCLKLSTTS